MDTSALSLCEENALPVKIVNIYNEDNILHATSLLCIYDWHNINNIYAALAIIGFLVKVSKVFISGA